MLDVNLKKQSVVVKQCKTSGQMLSKKVDDQADFLKRNRKLLDITQIE
jgi:hypothetical protein